MNTAQGQWSNNSVRRTLAGRSTKVKKIEKKKNNRIGSCVECIALRNQRSSDSNMTFVRCQHIQKRK